MKKIGLYGLFCVISIISSAQSTYTEDRKVKWEDVISFVDGDRTKSFMQFSSMGDLNPETDIPYISESILLPCSFLPDELEIFLSNKSFVWPTSKEHILFNNIINNEEIDFTYAIYQSGNKFYIDLNIVPVKRKPEAPSFLKLSAYTINISYKKKVSTLKSSNFSSSYKDKSILSEGNWVKVRISNTGIHKISYSQLKEWGVANPLNVGIFGNGGRLLPTLNSDHRYDDLVQNSVWHHNNSVYFYAEGPVVWEYSLEKKMFLHKKSTFNNHSYYFITEMDSVSKSVMDSPFQETGYDKVVRYFNDYSFHEEDNFNLLKSGSIWLGEKFDYYTKPYRIFSFSFPNTLIGAKSDVYIKVAGRSNTKTEFELFANESSIGTTDVYNVSTSSNTSYFARESSIISNYDNTSDDISLRVNFNLNKDQTSSIGYLDYICLNVDRKLSFVENQLSFRNIDFVYDYSKVRYEIDNSVNLKYWDVTNPLTPLNINTINTEGTSSFDYKANQLREFVAFDPSGDFSSPEFVKNVKNQNLHGSDFVDYIIVCHPNFEKEANRLGMIHQEYDNMTYKVVTTEMIYNEFSSGKTDVTAIREFVRMLYIKAGNDNNKKPKNLLLFGDGSYDNRQGIIDNTNKIPTYQSLNSIHQTNSFVTDDYFGLLDDNEGTNIKSGKVDIGIGRFPVNTIEEAKNAVDKTYRYYNDQLKDSWKSELTFVGDDGDNNIHMNDANSLTTKIEDLYPEFNITKLYFDDFEKITSTSGQKIPEIENRISQSINRGTLLFNYTGHGSPSVLGNEKIITIPKINSWNNSLKLPVFITATCEFGRFDDKEYTSAGELMFLNPLGGGIALFTTTRIVYSSLNKRLNHSFYDFVFERDENNKPYTLGQIMRHTKNNLSASVNKLNFTLLGDPAIRLIYPKLKISTKKINGKDIFVKFRENMERAPIDSLKALSKIKITGEVIDGANIPLKNFNGQIFVSVLDKKSQLTTRGNNGATPFSYQTFDKLIFKGAAYVSNGKFDLEFIVPKDIKYNYGSGKICYYAFSDDSEKEAFGAFSDVTIGGINNNTFKDVDGPTINLWLNNKSFVNNNKVGALPVLIAEIYDESGINTTGNGIGHDITCIIDDSTSDIIVLNKEFKSLINDYKRGSIQYQLPNLEEGYHNVTLKAWDTYNNSSTQSIEFMVFTDENIIASNVKVYPNPVVNNVSSYISFQHDEPNVRMDINLLIYNMAGQLLVNTNRSVVSLLNTIPPIEFKAQTSNGLPLIPGIYIYKIIINSQTGRKGFVSGKIMVANSK